MKQAREYLETSAETSALLCASSALHEAGKISAALHSDFQQKRNQRVDGHALIRFSKHGISDLYQRAPCRLLFPDSEEGEAPLAVLITTSGGLTGGDKLLFELEIERGARGTVSTQAAEKLYRVLDEDDDIRIETHIRVGEGGQAEWLSQEAILFDRTRLRRSLHVDLAKDARFLGVEMTMLGRDAMGETYRTGLLHDAWRIRSEGRLIWADALHLEGDCARLCAQPFGFGDARALATLVYSGPDAGQFLDLARSLVPAPWGGATLIGSTLILRLMHRDNMILRAATLEAISAMRAATLGASPQLPALWTC